MQRENIRLTTVEHKQHLLTLDGLRGVAAIGVVLWHVSESFQGRPWEPHSILAVDFFFMLSGFVLGYAYEERLQNGKLSQSGFIKARLIRLMPLATLGAIIGIVSSQTHDVGTILLGILLLPNFFGSGLFILNPPAWSLSLELWGSVLYGAVGLRVKDALLALLVVVAAGWLVVSAFHYHALSAGYAPGNYLGGFPRFLFPFLAGLLIYRTRRFLPKTSLPFMVSSLVLLLLFAVPGEKSWTPVYDLICDFVIFPILIIAGVNHQPSVIFRPICDSLGRLSYPLYAIHWPVLIGLLTLLHRTHLHSTAAPVKVTAFLLVLGLSRLAQGADEPFRQFLSRNLFKSKLQTQTI